MGNELPRVPIARDRYTLAAENTAPNKCLQNNTAQPSTRPNVCAVNFAFVEVYLLAQATNSVNPLFAELHIRNRIRTP